MYVFHAYVCMQTDKCKILCMYMSAYVCMPIHFLESDSTFSIKEDITVQASMHVYIVVCISESGCMHVLVNARA
jgi:hypothetical protein